MNLHPFQLDTAEPEDELSRRLTRALAAPPAFTIPDGFAARIAANASALPAPRAAGPSFASLATRYSLAALLAAMFVLAFWTQAHARTNPLEPLLIETLFAVEFVALTTWFSLRPPSSSS
jgi:hypothetical protein